MKALLAVCAFAAALAFPAAAQSDPKLDFLGYCIAQGSSSNYCACMADKLAVALPGNDLAVYNDYLAIVATGEQNPQVYLDTLTEKHGISKKDVARILTAANAVLNDTTACAGL